MSRSEQWWFWAALLAALYLLSAYLARERVLINTEIWALYYAGRPLAEQLEAIRQDLVHPPLMYLIERGWLGLLGQTDAAAKLLPLAINIPALVLFTRLARRVTSRWRLASFLFACGYLAPGDTLTLVRMYGLLVLLMVAAILIWDRWREQPSATSLAAWTALMTLAVYTHYSALLLAAGFLAANWVFGPRRLAFTAAAAVPAIAFLPWALFVWPVYQSRGLETNLWWVHMLLAEPYKGLALMMYEYLGSMPVTGLGRYLAAAGAVLLHGLLLVFSAGAIRRMWPPRRDSDPESRWFWTAAMLAGVPVVLLLLFSITVTPALASRFLIGIFPAYWLLLVLLAGAGGRRALRVLYGLMLPWALIAASGAVVNNLGTPAVRARVELLASQLQPGDLILTLDETGNQVYWELTHRLGRTARIEALRRQRNLAELSLDQRRGIEQGERLSVVPHRNIGEIDLGSVRRVWVFHESVKPDETLAAHLASRGFSLERTIGGEPPRLSEYRLR